MNIIKAWLMQYAMWLVAAVAAAGWLAAGVQTVRLAEAKASFATANSIAATGALDQYKTTAERLDTASQGLIKATEARNASLKKTAKQVVEYVARPAAAVECVDDDGLRLITDIGRGKSTDSSPSAAALPLGATTPARP